jgi:hypothetical protein
MRAKFNDGTTRQVYNHPVMSLNYKGLQRLPAEFV